MAAKKEKISELLTRRTEAVMKITVIEALLSLIEDNFCERDGQRAKNLLLTDDGRQVPLEIIHQVIDDIRESKLVPTQEQVKKIDNMEI